MALDFLAIGDTVADTFIKLEHDQARVTCDAHGENCMIAMHYGDKIPFESATLVPGVGNSANAAVSAARLGLSSGILTWLGGDRLGDECRATFEKEGVALDHIDTEAEKATNSHYVLWYPPDRTILIKHEAYDYAFPADLTVPRAVYLSSIGEAGLALHDALADWLAAHPEVLLAFQPGTFQMAAGTERLARIYARTNVFIANKEEFQRILATKEEDEKKLMEMMRAKGPKTVFLTDGGNGAYVLTDEGAWKIGLYPDPRPPFERTGAGDAFSSTAVCAMLLGKSAQEALTWGPINSMSVVQGIGAREGLLSREKLLDLLAHPPAPYAPEAL
jgi:sugar/nucleoside kinase (ribokinase family)